MVAKDIPEILFEALYQSLITAKDLELIEKSMGNKTEAEILAEIFSKGILTREQLDHLEKSENFILDRVNTISQEEKHNCLGPHELDKIIDRITGFIPEKEFLERFSRWSHYEICEQIGKGDLGIVYKAYDTTLDRIVAIKMMKPKEAIQDRQIKRFYREARVYARLNHPNIVNIFESNVFFRCPYLVMEYIEGKNLASLLKERVFSPREIAVIIKKIADALAFAHKNGIIHRDVKPRNIMVDSDLEPKIMDFGIAKSLESSLLHAGEISGTSVYMAPEQIRGKGIDARSDVYSLGATLYEMICRATPFPGDDIGHLFYQILEKEPVSPGKINPGIPSELEAICLKCLEKDPGKRYQNALDLALDMENFLQNRPVLAKRPAWITHTKKLVYRNKILMSLVSFFVILFCSAFVLYIWEINLGRMNAQIAKEKAEKNKKGSIQAKEKAIRESQKAWKNNGCLLRPGGNRPDMPWTSQNENILF
mgnify:CR=1 FL=1